VRGKQIYILVTIDNMLCVCVSVCVRVFVWLEEEEGLTVNWKCGKGMRTLLVCVLFFFL
jgi:hypothetical protein